MSVKVIPDEISIWISGHHLIHRGLTKTKGRRSRNFPLFFSLTAWVGTSYLIFCPWPEFHMKLYQASSFWQIYLQIFGEGTGNPLQYSCLENPMDGGAWKAAVHGIAKSWTELSNLTFTFHFHALEEEMASHPSVLAWRIPGMADPGGLPSMGSHRVRHDWIDLAAASPNLRSTLRVLPWGEMSVFNRSRQEGMEGEQEFNQHEWKW